MHLSRSLLAAIAVFFLARTGVGHAAIEAIDPHALYPEGPLWDQGRLLFVEYAGPGIKIWDDGSEAKVWWRRDHCGASALIHYRGNHILVACYDGNYLVELDAKGKELRTIDKDSSGTAQTISPAPVPAAFIFQPPAYSTPTRRLLGQSCTYQRTGKTSEK